jgi:hypothetical protein
MELAISHLSSQFLILALLLSVGKVTKKKKNKEKKTTKYLKMNKNKEKMKNLLPKVLLST